MRAQLLRVHRGRAPGAARVAARASAATEGGEHVRGARVVARALGDVLEHHHAGGVDDQRATLLERVALHAALAEPAPECAHAARQGAERQDRADAAARACVADHVAALRVAIVKEGKSREAVQEELIAQINHYAAALQDAIKHMVA